jgi:hypothetical protein
MAKQEGAGQPWQHYRTIRICTSSDGQVAPGGDGAEDSVVLQLAVTAEDPQPRRLKTGMVKIAKATSKVMKSLISGISSCRAAQATQAPRQEQPNSKAPVSCLQPAEQTFASKQHSDVPVSKPAAGYRKLATLGNKFFQCSSLRCCVRPTVDDVVM